MKMPVGTLASDIIYRLLSQDGTIDGEHHAAGDYSSAEQDYYFQDLNRGAILTRLVVYYEDVGAFDTTKYGNNIDLAKGIQASITDENDVVLSDLFGHARVHTNGHWSAVCHDIRVHDFGQGTTQAMSARWTFRRDLLGEGFYLGAGDKFKITLNDNFSGLSDQVFTVRGAFV